jgi:hypothetical protein
MTYHSEFSLVFIGVTIEMLQVVIVPDPNRFSKLPLNGFVPREIFEVVSYLYICVGFSRFCCTGFAGLEVHAVSQGRGTPLRFLFEEQEGKEEFGVI